MRLQRAGLRELSGRTSELDRETQLAEVLPGVVRSWFREASASPYTIDAGITKAYPLYNKGLASDSRHQMALLLSSPLLR